MARNKKTRARTPKPNDRRLTKRRVVRVTTKHDGSVEHVFLDDGSVLDCVQRVSIKRNELIRKSDRAQLDLMVLNLAGKFDLERPQVEAPQAAGPLLLDKYGRPMGGGS